MRNLFLLTLLFPFIGWAQRGSEPIFQKDSLGKETYALVIGISKYEKFSSLHYADADAIAFANYLKDSAGLNLPSKNVRLLINDQAKNGDILENGMVWLEQNCKKGSKAIIYFAGHGVSVGNNNAYLMAYNVSPQFNKANIFYSGGVPLFNVKRDFIAPMHEKGVEVLLIIDACRSFDAVTGKDGLTLLSQSTLDDNTGEIRILSSSNAQQSFEDVPGNIAWYGHGVFTFYLLQGLYGKADIINKDGQITFNEIKRYLQIKVPEATGFKQEPAFCCDQNLQATIGYFNKSYVETDFLKQIAANKSQLLAVNAKGRGVVQSVTVPDEIKPMVDSFYLNIQRKHFFGNFQADYYFTKIQKLDSLYKAEKEEVLLNYCGTLSNEIQFAIGEYLEGDIKTARASLDIPTENSKEGMASSPEVKEKPAQWEDIFGTTSRSAQRLYELRQKYYPSHPYNEVAEMKYYFCKGRSFYHKNKDSVLYYINKALKLDSNQAYLYHVAALVSNGVVALAYNEKCLELYPDFKYAWDLRGTILKDLKRYQEAEKALLKCLQLDSANTDCYNNLGTVYAAENKYKEAELIFKKTLSLDPDYRLAYRNLGDLYSHQKRKQEAEQMYLKAIRVDSAYTWSWLCLGDFYYEQGRFKEAEQNYKYAVHKDSLNLIAYIDLGNLYLKQKRYAEAETMYRTCIRFNSKYKWAYGNLGVLYYNLNRFDEAEKMYLYAIQIDSMFQWPYTQLGSMYRKTKRYEEAERMLLKAVEMDSLDKYTYNSLGNLYFDQKRFKEAENIYLKAILIDSAYNLPYYNLGILYKTQNMLNLAEKMSLKSVFIDSTYIDGYYSLGIIYKIMGRLREAETMYLKVIRIDSTYIDAYNNLGGLYLGQSRLAEAESVLRKAISIDSNYVYSQVYLGDVYRRQNLIDKALEKYQKGTRLSPAFKYPYSAIGKIYLNRKEYQNALLYYNKLLKIDSLDATGLSNVIISYIQLHDTTNAVRLFNKEMNRKLLGYFEYYLIGNAFKESGNTTYAEKALLKSYILKPDYTYTLSSLCVLYIKGSYSSEKYEPLIIGLKNQNEDMNTAYNLACIYALLKKEAEFEHYLKKSLELGYKNWENIANDTDLDNFRNNEKFKELIKKYRN
ncbi:MAG: tetratricopeptide repeat protein [Bacteroidetes bacterium]|nr:tetratricopeptide repeat protein [Bacteroidota bacterium]